LARQCISNLFTSYLLNVVKVDIDDIDFEFSEVVKRSERKVWDVTIKSKERFESTTFPPRSTMFRGAGWIVSARVKDGEDVDAEDSEDSDCSNGYGPSGCSDLQVMHILRDVMPEFAEKCLNELKADDTEASKAKASDRKTVEDNKEQKEETVIRIETKAEVKEDIEELVEKVNTTLMSTKLKDAEDEDSDDSEGSEDTVNYYYSDSDDPAIAEDLEHIRLLSLVNPALGQHYRDVLKGARH